MNTNREAMAYRCPKAKPMGGFYLPNHRLIFRGVADFRADKDAILPVVLWQITDDCLAALDMLEGYPDHYDRRVINREWIIYDMNGNKNHLYKPSGGYYNMIQDGYKYFGLDDYNLRSAKRDAELSDVLEVEETA
jgi:hypothetical protein|tara:strand:- start:140 stop:544 length:405 start_codon:yes stop_codon:yes gene_type:complete